MAVHSEHWEEGRCIPVNSSLDLSGPKKRGPRSATLAQRMAGQRLTATFRFGQSWLLVSPQTQLWKAGKKREKQAEAEDVIPLGWLASLGAGHLIWSGDEWGQRAPGPSESRAGRTALPRQGPRDAERPCLGHLKAISSINKAHQSKAMACTVY